MFARSSTRLSRVLKNILKINVNTKLMSILSLLFDESFSYFFFFLKNLNCHQILFSGGYWYFPTSGSCHCPAALVPDPGPQFIFPGPNPKFVFPSLSLQFVFPGSPLGPGPEFVFPPLRFFQATFKLFISTLILDFAFLNYFFKQLFFYYFSLKNVPHDCGSSFQGIATIPLLNKSPKVFDKFLHP